MDQPPYLRALPFTTAEGVALWAVPLPVDEVAPLGSPTPRFTPGVLMIYRDGPQAGEEQGTFGLSAVQTYAQREQDVQGSINYSSPDLARLAELCEMALQRIEAAKAQSPGPRLRLSALALRFA
jgi:hypothetical protein